MAAGRRNVAEFSNFINWEVCFLSKYIGAKCRFCRRAGKRLFLKGSRCSSPLCAIERRNYAPGQHGKRKVKISEYGLQHKEKQVAKRIYGIAEKQFRNYFKKADRIKGITGENLLILLEKRLDNVVYRLGFARSRSEARQIVRHNHILINGRKVNIPSYIVKAGDVIEIKNSEDLLTLFKIIADETESRSVPEWLDCDKEKYKGKMICDPKRKQIDSDVNETFIVELYSK